MKYNTDNFQQMTNEFTMQNKSNTDNSNVVNESQINCIWYQIKTCQNFQIKVSKIILAYSKPKVYVTETGMYISPSSESLTEVLLKEVNSKLDYWEKEKENNY